jgi:bla regulator protein blaR1
MFARAADGIGSCSASIHFLNTPIAKCTIECSAVVNSFFNSTLGTRMLTNVSSMYFSRSFRRFAVQSFRPISKTTMGWFMTEVVARNRGKLALFVAALLGFVGSLNVAQESAMPGAAQAADTNTACGEVNAFEVVSIRPSKPGTPWRIQFLPDEYLSINRPLISTILWAYFPRGLMSRERVSGAPAWVMNDGYDIEAKFDDAAANGWQHLTGWERQKCVKPLLQTLLAERFKLVLHRIPAEVQGYALVVGKNGPKLRETKPDETMPSRAIQLPGGGAAVSFLPGQKKEVDFFDTSMASLADDLTNVMGLPFLDQTGLTGKYDFVLPKRDLSSTEASPDGTAFAPELDDRWNYWDWEAIGLKVKPVKVRTTNLAIDHVERPSPN